jgi:hypothetical protein
MKNNEMSAEMPMQDATPAVAVEQKKPEKSVEIQKYEIDKKFEIQQQKLGEATQIVVGRYNLTAISMLAEKFSKCSDMIPKDFQNNPEKCFAAIYKGATLGLDAFTSLQKIAIINGRATIWGDTALAVVRNSGLLEKFEETLIEENANMIARCVLKRVGEKEYISEFTQADAVKAGLWTSNVWAKYPKRMLKYRARAYALRDIFPDVLEGLYLKEEIEESDNFDKKIKTVSKLDNSIASDQDSEALNDAQLKLFSKKNDS